MTPPATIQPDQIALMGAVAQTFRLTDGTLAYEPKYDGIRVKVSVSSGASPNPVTLWSRTGNVITSQFPDVVDALTSIRRRVRRSLVLDVKLLPSIRTATRSSLKTYNLGWASCTQPLG